MTITKCNQERCSYNIAQGGELLCPECASCGAESNVIDEDCVCCWNCSKDEGIVRSGIPKVFREAIKEKMKDVIKIQEEKVTR